MDRKTKAAALTYKRLREVWKYDPDTGIWTRIEAAVKGPGGSPHGIISVQGYRVIPVDGIQYPGTKLAWMYMKGQWPERNVQLVNQDKLDLRWANLKLRPAKLVKSGRRSLTVDRLKEALKYDPATGRFTWNVWAPRIKIGDEAGVITDTGYRIISLDGEHHLAHRLAMLYVNGRWPVHQVDHINGVRADNRIENLRDATPMENARNGKRRPGNSSGYKGVSRARGRWKAQITANYHIIPLGIFDTPEEAHAAYCAAAQKYHGDFANPGASATESEELH